MKRLMTIVAGTSAIAEAVGAVPTAALAQAGQTTITIYGNDPCPRENICIRAPESQRYRLPQSQNPQGTRQQRQSWAQKSKQIMTVGNTGAGTCSPVGPGGYTGCMVQEINQARQDTKEQQQQNSPPQR
jgi:hypothetical protein